MDTKSTLLNCSLGNEVKPAVRDKVRTINHYDSELIFREGNKARLMMQRYEDGDSHLDSEDLYPQILLTSQPFQNLEMKQKVDVYFKQRMVRRSDDSASPCKERGSA
jgi:hypothetical protein